jgi:cytosine/creatinine deaminase
MVTGGPLLLAGATLPDGTRADVLVADGVIAAVEAPGGAPAAGAEQVNLDGTLLSAAFVEGHIHLDKSFVGGGWRPHVPGDALDERIAAEARLLAEADAEVPVAERALALVRQIAAYGTGWVRSHVDVHTEVGLAGVEMLLALRERCADLVELQIVAFPQRGVIADPGAAALLDAALSAGAEVIGGLDPAGFDGDVDGQLDVIFDLAARHAAGIDIHLHDPGELGTSQLRRIAERTERAGMAGRVAVSHAYALGAVEAGELARTADALARAGVSIMTNAPGTGPMPPVLALRDAGVTVFAGSDNIRDAWWPYGNGDMLERASMIGYRQGLYTDDELRVAWDLATGAAARALGLPDHGIHPGAPAHLVAVEAGGVPEAVAQHPPRRLVLHGGKIVPS